LLANDTVRPEPM